MKNSLSKTVLCMTIMLLITFSLSLNAQDNQVNNHLSNDVEKISSEVEKMPQFPGGEIALDDYIYKTCKYPVKAIRSGSHEKVILRLVINKFGKVKNVETLCGLDPDLINEAIRVANSLPNWAPAEQNGEKVNAYYILPISFKLRKTDLTSLLEHENNSKKPVLVLNEIVLPKGYGMNRIKKEFIDSIQEIIPDTEEKKQELIKKYGIKAEDGVVLLKTKQTVPSYASKQSDDTEGHYYSIVEQMPVFPGGDEALMNFVTRNIKYPMEAFHNNEQGKVIVRFVVNKEGKVEKAQVIRGVSLSIDREALRVVNLIPDFTPGKQNGKTVNVYYTLPITFRLDSNNNNNYNFNNWADPKADTRGKINYHSTY